MTGSTSPDIGWSRLRGNGRVGRDFFARRDMVLEDPSPPRGLVDSVEQLTAEGTPTIHAAVRAFFEDCAGLELLIVPRWSFGFRLAGLLWHAIARVVGQLSVPIRPSMISVRVVALCAGDGPEHPRGVIRCYADTGRAMQVMAYGVTVHGARRYLNASFPLPLSHLTGLLRLDPIVTVDDQASGVSLSSRRSHPSDRSGIWWVTRWFHMRVPLEETLSLWAVADAPDDLAASELEGCTLVGVHEQRIFGLCFVRHRYWFRPSKEDH
jgi:hypothetical protein